MMIMIIILRLSIPITMLILMMIFAGLLGAGRRYFPLGRGPPRGRGVCSRGGDLALQALFCREVRCRNSHRVQCPDPPSRLHPTPPPQRHCCWLERRHAVELLFMESMRIHEFFMESMSSDSRKLGVQIASSGAWLQDARRRHSTIDFAKLGCVLTQCSLFEVNLHVHIMDVCSARWDRRQVRVRAVLLVRLAPGVYLCVYMYIYIYTCIYVYIYIYIHTYIYIYTYIHICILYRERCTYMCVYTHIHTSVYTYNYTYIICIYIYIYTYLERDIYIYIYIYIYREREYVLAVRRADGRQP